MTVLELVAWVLGGINVLTFLVYGWDKLCAIFKWRRISERFLLGCVVGGGVVGALVGMWFFKHKTAKESFQLPLVMIIVGQILLAIGLVKIFS